MTVPTTGPSSHVTRAARHTRPFRVVGVTLALALALSACGSQTDPGGPASSSSPASGTTTEPLTPTTKDEPVTPTDGPTTGPVPVPGTALPTGPVPPAVLAAPPVQDAIADLAAREAVSPSDVSVAGYAEVTWSDGSLGCPEPGMMYTQALVPGEQLVLQVAEQLFSYHAASGKAFAYCASPVPPAGGSTTR